MSSGGVAFRAALRKSVSSESRGWARKRSPLSALAGVSPSEERRGGCSRREFRLVLAVVIGLSLLDCRDWGVGVPTGSKRNPGKGNSRGEAARAEAPAATTDFLFLFYSVGASTGQIASSVVFRLCCNSYHLSSEANDQGFRVCVNPDAGFR